MNIKYISSTHTKFKNSTLIFTNPIQDTQLDKTGKHSAILA